MRVLAWILAIVGAIMAYIISLAGAMRTVPQLYWREALIGVPLPIVAGALAAWCLFRPARPPQAITARPWISAGVPLVLALLTLLPMAVSYFEQPGGPM
ncbi:MAG: hypothetical protein HY268_16890 [Deltaproteobacteria bacterium]|nr:hypothetical protein [Deltaproteobacteria bacterium]